MRQARLPPPVPAFAVLRRRRHEPRSLERLRAHYQLEVGLARRLMDAPRTQRLSGYGLIYDELFAGVPDHPQHTRLHSGARSHLEAQLKALRPHLHEAQTFMEIGAGDCRLSLAVCRLVHRVIAVDVSNRLLHLDEAPDNFSFVLSDGTSIPAPGESVDIAYSNQLMEHLHPDDALEQLNNIYNALKPGGVYCCLTPNRISGPHDISVYFNTVAQGLHLKEYSYRELTDAFERSGFKRVAYRVGRLGSWVPRPLLFAAEALLESVPERWRPLICQSAFVGRLLGICAFAWK